MESGKMELQFIKVVKALVFLMLVGRICLGAGGAPAGPHVPSAAERNAHAAELAAAMQPFFDQFVNRVEQPDATPSIRDLPNAALAVLLLGEDPHQAEKLLDLCFAQQDMDPNSRTYGSVPWQIGHPDIHDENAIDFSNQAVGPILIHYGDKLSPEFKQRLIPHMKASFASMLRRKLPVSYTNIWLMRTVNMILMGQAIHDSAAEDEGYRELDQWIDYTRQAGIHEFDSPTYYLVDLNSLNLGYLYVSRPGAREKFKVILDYFWTDIAANCFVPNGVLSGPSSRNYSFLSSSAGMDLYLYFEGLRASILVAKPNFENIFVLETAAEQAYHPGRDLIALASEPERVVESRWDLTPDRNRYHYLTPDFAIGSASGDYGAQDKLITVELTDGDKIPVITIIPDVFDSPYGTVKSLDRSGHSKPTHLPLHATCVQEKGALLALMDVDASKAPQTDSLATNILLPARAQRITLDDQPLSTKKLFETAAAKNCVIGVQNGKAGIAIRIFHADPVEGAELQTLLKLDADGMKNHAARYVAYQYRGRAKRLADKHVGFGILILARKCESSEALSALVREAREAKIQDTRARDLWSVRADVEGRSLFISRDVKKNQLVSREVDGKQENPATLSLNAKDLAGEIWRRLAPETAQPPLTNEK